MQITQNHLHKSKILQKNPGIMKKMDSGYGSLSQVKEVENDRKIFQE